MDGEGAGKGDSYRRVNKKIYDEHMDAIFGKHELEKFQKCHHYVIKPLKKEPQNG